MLPFDTEAMYTLEGEKVGWSTFHLMHVPLAGVLSQLSKLQLDIRTTEAQAVLHMIRQPAASDPPSGS
jgi:hypothetical protein